MIEISYFAGGVLDTTVTSDTLRTFDDCDAIACWLEAIDPAVDGVPHVDPPKQGTSEEQVRAFKAALPPHKTRVAMFSPFVFALGCS